MKFRKNKLQRIQMSESLILGFFLAFSGGFMDSYTYIFRNGVFANAQTGNIILLGINIFEGSYKNSLKYLIPVCSFVIGVFIAQFIRIKFGQIKVLHWRQITVIIEIIIMLTVAFISTQYNVLANSLVSFACGIQVQSFQKIRGNKLATTMCIGNLRTATELLCNWFHTKNSELVKKSMLYYSVILVFALGAVCGNFLVKCFGQRAILASAVILIIAFIIMFVDDKEEDIIEKEENQN